MRVDIIIAVIPIGLLRLFYRLYFSMERDAYIILGLLFYAGMYNFLYRFI